jgi:hypothetical protein
VRTTADPAGPTAATHPGGEAVGDAPGQVTVRITPARPHGLKVTHPEHDNVTLP